MENHKQIISEAARKGFLEHYRDETAANSRHFKNALAHSLTTLKRNPGRYLFDPTVSGPLSTVGQGVGAGISHAKAKLIGAKNIGNVEKAKKIFSKMDTDPNDREYMLASEALKDNIKTSDEIRKDSPFHYGINPLLRGPISRAIMKNYAGTVDQMNKGNTMTAAQKRIIAKLQAGK